jgi:hypothetical protein
MKTYTFPQNTFFGDVFAIVKTLSGTYLCPGWHSVPDGTTRNQIKFEELVNVLKKVTLPVSPKREWQVEGSKAGVTYTISDSNGSWNCSCPAKSFNRGDCKHIKAKKAELLTTLS